MSILLSCNLTNFLFKLATGRPPFDLAVPLLYPGRLHAVARKLSYVPSMLYAVPCSHLVAFGCVHGHNVRLQAAASRCDLPQGGDDERLQHPHTLRRSHHNLRHGTEGDQAPKPYREAPRNWVQNAAHNRGLCCLQMKGGGTRGCEIAVKHDAVCYGMLGPVAATR